MNKVLLIPLIVAIVAGFCFLMSTLTEARPLSKPEQMCREHDMYLRPWGSSIVGVICVVEEIYRKATNQEGSGELKTGVIVWPFPAPELWEPIQQDLADRFCGASAWVDQKTGLFHCDQA